MLASVFPENEDKIWNRTGQICKYVSSIEAGQRGVGEELRRLEAGNWPLASLKEKAEVRSRAREEKILLVAEIELNFYFHLIHVIHDHVYRNTGTGYLAPKYLKF